MWNRYDKLRGKPNDSLMDALERIDVPEKTAVDIGCGKGCDALELVRQGWTVTAIDSRQDAIDQIEPQENLTAVCGDFITTDWPRVYLFNASFSLPFCGPYDFPSLWEKIVESIHAGGWFVGHFFGVEDEWTHNKEMTFFDKRSLVEMFESDFLMDEFQEFNGPRQTVDGEKHWHVFTIRAKRE